MCDEESVKNLEPVGILLEELRSDDINTRIKSLQNLKTIALVLGSERTRNELIPYLSEIVYDEDEVLVTLVDQLRDFTPLIGGQDYISFLLAPLEILAAVEEAIVRDKAGETLNYLVQFHSDEDIKNHLIPMMKRLAEGEWFTSRCTVTNLFTSVYQRADTSFRQELIELFKKLASDETPMVRRAAATKLKDFVLAIEPEIVYEKLNNTLQMITDDDQDSIRLLALGSCVSFSQIYDHKQILERIVPIVKKASEDKSWRIRCMVAENIVGLQKHFGDSLTSEYLVPIFESLLNDAEAEVKSSIVNKMKDFCHALPEKNREETIMSKFFPVVNMLVTETPYKHVKTALASQVMTLAPLIGPQNVLEHLIPIFLAQLRDDDAEVRLGVIRNLDNINSVVGVQQLADNLLPAIVQLSEDKKWRVRLAIIEYVPLLAGQLGLPALNDEELTGLCMNRLLDNVYAVREAAVLSLRALVAKFGVDWTRRQVLPRMLQLSGDSNYLYRMICLLSILNIGEVCDDYSMQNDLLNILVEMSSDKVPNVRFKTAQILAKLGRKFDSETLQSTVNNILQRLNKDEDGDVSFYACLAIQELNLC